MPTETIKKLYELATDLAIMHFDNPTNDHIETIFDRLLINQGYGMGSYGSVTIH